MCVYIYYIYIYTWTKPRLGSPALATHHILAIRGMILQVKNGEDFCPQKWRFVAIIIEAKRMFFIYGTEDEMRISGWFFA